MTQGNSSTTIRTHLLKATQYLALFLTDFRGRVLRYALRLANAESCALTAIESTLLNSKVITLQRNSSEQLGSLRPGTISISERLSQNPHAFVNDVVNGRIKAREVTMEQWIQGTVMAMISSHQPHLDIEIPYGGGTYKFHHCIQTVNPPVGDTRTILEDTQ